MSVELNHTIVRTSDKRRSATFLAEILGVPLAEQWGHFQPIELANGITLEYLDVEGPVQSQHYSFLVSDEVFDAAMTRILETGVEHWSDPFHHDPGRVNHNYGGRGVYFNDPDGHNMELQTVPYGANPQG